MTENRYAISEDDFLAGARIPAEAQVEEQAVDRPVPPDLANPVNPYGDGMGGDVDGD